MNEEYVFVGKLSEGFRRVKTGSRKDRKCGFVDENGEVVIPLIYSNVHDFHEGMAAVRMGNWANNEWGYINTKGELIIPLKYHLPNHFESGLLKTRIEDEWFFLDKEGNKVIDLAPYDHALTFSENYSVVSKYGAKGRSKMGVIDKTGREVIPCIYPYTCYFKKSDVERGVELYLRDSKVCHGDGSDAKPLTDEEWNKDRYSDFYADNAETEDHPDTSDVENREDLVIFTPDMLSVLVEEYQKVMPSRKDIFLIETQVAGTTYRKNINDLEHLLVQEQVCWLVREPDNRFDSNAVAIYFETDKLGYIPAEQNEIIARLMDVGKFFYCKLISKEWVNGWLRLVIGVYLKD
ncbi:MAG: WG repeat-containing protein [Bacteroidales bacterium]